MHIEYKDLALPVSKRFVDAITNLTEHQQATSSITINFRDPNYSAENGGFHPVEIRLEKHADSWHFCYITDFTYVGIGPFAELAKDLDFDFQAGVFQNLHGLFPIEVALDIYQIWEGNFLYYWQALNVFTIQIASD
ncbi:MAG: DUF2787 domain-containing protein [Alteromonadaceae bacterium TMED7]|nr:MAG: DUF2787 domain-containing protein [Alteromonadaceae bacterium TMED7]|tara:strand:+ start:6909 stop:7316 length:408 start_codon:yes stop_codon:yes gene_type:complete